MRRLHAAAGVIVGAIALLNASPAGAGASVYDMSALLAEPHPFESGPPTPAAPRPFAFAPAMPVPGVTPAPVPPRAVPPTPAPTASEAARAAAVRPAAGSADPALLKLGIGYYDINDDQGAAEFHVEWRGHAFLWKLKPMAGAMATSDVALYGYGGIAIDFRIGDRLVLTPSFAAGLYANGDGKDLGSAIEFRSAAELAWRFNDGARAGVTFYHLSNAGIGDTNPGTEVLSLGYSIPLD